jgi:cytosine/adenosine deaminase-related metal-dependent hydrolase
VIRRARVLDLSAADGMSAPVDIVVEDGLVAAVDPPETALLPGDEVIEAAGSLAMPGLVNAHFHSSGTFNRGLVDNLPLELFMLYELPPFDFGPFPAELYRARVLLGAVEMLKTGVTAVFDDPIYDRRGDRRRDGRLPRQRAAGDGRDLPAEHAGAFLVPVHPRAPARGRPRPFRARARAEHRRGDGRA